MFHIQTQANMTTKGTTSNKMASNQATMSTYLPPRTAQQTKAQHMQRQDSVAGIRKQRNPTAAQLQIRRKAVIRAALRDRELQKKYAAIMENGARKKAATEARIHEDHKKAQNSMVLVNFKIEHCTYLTNAIDGRQTGRALRSENCDPPIPVQTIYAPLTNIKPTTFQETAQALRRLYFAQFGNRHRGHRKPCEHQSGIIMELYLNCLNQAEFRVTEENWMTTLARLTLNRVQFRNPHLQDMNAALRPTLTARFTCPVLKDSLAGKGDMVK